MADGSDDLRPEIRISDADRDAAVVRLSDAMAEGRLDVAEFERQSVPTGALGCALGGTVRVRSYSLFGDLKLERA